MLFSVRGCSPSANLTTSGLPLCPARERGGRVSRRPRGGVRRRGCWWPLAGEVGGDGTGPGQALEGQVHGKGEDRESTAHLAEHGRLVQLLDGREGLLLSREGHEAAACRAARAEGGGSDDTAGLAKAWAQGPGARRSPLETRVVLSRMIVMSRMEPNCSNVGLSCSAVMLCGTCAEVDGSSAIRRARGVGVAATCRMVGWSRSGAAEQLDGNRQRDPSPHPL